MPYACGRTISALWAINETDNVWAWVDGLGWRKLDTTNVRDLLLVAAWPTVDLANEENRCCYILAQSQLFPQLHSLLSFMGQFLPVFLQFGLSAANETVQRAATRIENNVFV